MVIYEDGAEHKGLVRMCKVSELFRRLAGGA